MLILTGLTVSASIIIASLYPVVVIRPPKYGVQLMKVVLPHYQDIMKESMMYIVFQTML